MKIKNLVTMALVAVAIVFGVCSCGSDDDDEPEAALAAQVMGAYTGEEILSVMGDDFDSTPTYEFVKSSDNSVDMTIPATTGGSMNIPALPVKNITLTKSEKAITGRLASFAGTVVNADGSEKSYTVTDLVAIFNDRAVVVTFSLKYGNMPFAFIGKFTGTKK